jgi:hypothetical protein
LGAAGPSARPSVSQQWAANEDVATSAKDVPRLENAFSMMRKRERTREREEEGHREEERMREREDDRERGREDERERERERKERLAENGRTAASAIGKPIRSQ